eukprot:12329424-Alexandrium_andersonii.AAC.1
MSASLVGSEMCIRDRPSSCSGVLRRSPLCMEAGVACRAPAHCCCGMGYTPRVAGRCVSAARAGSFSRPTMALLIVLHCCCGVTGTRPTGIQVRSGAGYVTASGDISATGSPWAV